MNELDADFVAGVNELGNFFDIILTFIHVSLTISTIWILYLLYKTSKKFKRIEKANLKYVRIVSQALIILPLVLFFLYWLYFYLRGFIDKKFFTHCFDVNNPSDCFGVFFNIIYLIPPTVVISLTGLIIYYVSTRKVKPF
jgi:hypothetical protein